MLSLNRTDIVRLENALQRIEKGTYGKCIKCGKDIRWPVRYVPEALMCVLCSDKGQANRS